MGLLGATGVGVGAIVGGGILALAGVAFAETGPSAILAFLLNGVIALITALSFAALARRFPESGGTYTFSKKVFSVEAAFIVGWIVWFASIVAAVLYALGFAAFAILALKSVVPDAPAWIGSRWSALGLAIGATLAYTALLTIRKGGGGQTINVAKIITFAILIAGGFVFLARGEAPPLRQSLAPFFAQGGVGLITAMGFTFIALQGFDLIAAVGGEVRDPEKNIPRAMLMSLGIALLIYIPLLFVVSTAGVAEGESITGASAKNPETIIAIAAQRFLGPFGYWLVIVAAILSMLSALQANVYAASRVAFSMARDHTLPRPLMILSKGRQIPVLAVMASAASIAVVLIVIPDVASAGAAASLIFLVSFALAHWMSVLARGRGGERLGKNVPVPIFGFLACVGLGVFQGIQVPSAGTVVLVWILIGGLLYMFLFARRARVIDASSEGFDPGLVKLRGRSPLVLAPIANPENAESLVAVASALAPPNVGRVLLLTIIRPPRGESIEEDPQPLLEGQIVLREALAAGFTTETRPEALITIGEDPMREIVRVARFHRCQAILLGMTRLDENFDSAPLEDLMTRVGCNVAVLRAPNGWRIRRARRILIPLGGGNPHDTFRARLLGSLQRAEDREITFLRVVGPGVSDHVARETERALRRFARDEVRGDFNIVIERSGDVVETIAGHAAQHNLIVLGLPRLGRRRRFFGDLAIGLARRTGTPMIMLSRRG